MDIPTTGSLIAHKSYPTPLKYQNSFMKIYEYYRMQVSFQKALVYGQPKW